VNQHQ